MRSTQTVVALLAILLLAGVGEAKTAEVYRGPVTELPKAVAPPSTSGTIGMERLFSRAREVEGYDRWEFWWEVNRDEYYRLAVSRRLSGDDTFPAMIWQASRRSTELVTEGDVRTRIVPVLLDQLASPDPEMRGLAALALGKTRFTPALSPLKAMLAGPPGPDRNAAALAIGLLGDPLGVPALEGFLERNGVSPADRAYAAIGLGLLGSAKAAPVLRRALGASLGVGGRAAREYQTACVVALGLIRDRKSVPLLIGLVRSGDGRASVVRAAAAVALSRIGDTVARPVLVAALKDHDVAVRRAAAQALGGVGDATSRNALTLAFKKDGDVGVRNFAAIALARIGGRGVREILTTGLGQKNPRALRGFSAFALGVLGDRSAVADLKPLLEKKSEPSLVSAAAIGLAMLDDESSLPMLRSIASDGGRNQDLRGYAMTALAMLGDPIGAPTVRSAAGSPGFSSVRRAAFQVLPFLPGSPSVPRLLGGIFQETDPFVRGAAIGALHWLPLRSALDPILAVAAGRGFGRDAHKDAVIALGELAMRGRPSAVARFVSGVNYRSLSKAEAAVVGML